MKGGIINRETGAMKGEKWILMGISRAQWRVAECGAMMDGWARRLTEEAEHKLTEPVKTTLFSPSVFSSLPVALSLPCARLVAANEYPPLGCEAAQNFSVLLRVLTCSITHKQTFRRAVCKSSINMLVLKGVSLCGLVFFHTRTSFIITA